MILDRNFWTRAGERLAKTWLYSFAAVLLVVLGNPEVFDQSNALTPEAAFALPWVAALIKATMTTAPFRGDGCHHGQLHHPRRPGPAIRRRIRLPTC